MQTQKLKKTSCDHIVTTHGHMHTTCMYVTMYVHVAVVSTWVDACDSNNFFNKQIMGYTMYM